MCCLWFILLSFQSKDCNVLTFPEYENVVYHESSDWDIIIFSTTLFLKEQKMHNNSSKMKLSIISVYYRKPLCTGVKEKVMESFIGGHIALHLWTQNQITTSLHTHRFKSHTFKVLKISTRRDYMWFMVL